MLIVKSKNVIAYTGADKLKNYHHYEISNFSKYGYESKHNLTYWHNLNYYGFGLGASGYIDNIRYDNTRSLNNYIKGNYVLNKEVVDTNLSKEYYLILGLRLIDGINIRDYNNRYNDDLLKNEVNLFIICFSFLFILLLSLFNLLYDIIPLFLSSLILFITLSLSLYLQ